MNIYDLIHRNLAIKEFGANSLIKLKTSGILE